MGTRIRLRWAQNALYNLRSAPGVQAAIDSKAAAMASAAGSGYSWGSQQGAKRPQGRWRAIVYPDTWSAVRDNAKNNTLLRIFYGG